MTGLRAGSLCTGYGGLELGAELALGPLEHVFHGEFDPAPSKVLAHRWPEVPNLGDITAVTAAEAWADCGPIDLLLAGYPCQPFSSAGLRKGFDDPRNRWPDVHAAIRALRPRLVVLENVRGHLNRGFDTVVASLAAIGYVGRWRCVRASDAGAAHRRERLFIIAWPEETAAPWLRGADAPVLGDDLTLLPTPRAIDGETGRQTLVDGRTVGDRGPRLGDIVALLPTPRTSDANGSGQHGDGGMGLRTAVTLLPTPRARDGKGRDPNPRGGVDLNEAIHRLLPTPMTADGERQSATFTRGNPTLLGALLPTPKAPDGEKGGPNQHGSSGDLALPAAVQEQHWGAYASAVARWEAVIGRPAPDPTIAGRLGRRQLSPLFVEWLMGLPAGHVTDVLTRRTEALKVLGNGVVPQAAALALRRLLAEPHAT
jgi:DNA (cytosine-5)-methyltransferase 1